MGVGLELWLVALWGGVLTLERRAFLQAMFSRPLVAALGAGLITRDVEAGVYIGLVFELFHLGSASLGGSHPDLETLPAVMGTCFAAALGHVSGNGSTLATWSLSILLVAPMGPLGARLEARIDERARKYAGRAQTAIDSGDVTRVARLNLRAMWPQFVAFSVLSSLGWVAGHLLHSVWSQVPLPLLRGLAWAYPALGCVAAAIAVAGSHARGRVAIAVATSLFTAVLTAANLLFGAVA